MNIFTPSVAARHRVTEGMLEDLLYDPVMAVWVFWRVKLDAFQAASLRIMWFSSRVDNESGFGAGKTFAGYFAINLSAILIPETACGVIYQTMGAGKDNFWDYYTKLEKTNLLKAQLGGFTVEGEEGKASSKASHCWRMNFKNGSTVKMPAPGFMQDSNNLAGLNFNRVAIDEKNKILASEGGMKGVTKQILGRVRVRTFCEEHPVWQNKIWTLSTAETANHPAYPMHQRMEKEVLKGNPDYALLNFCYKDYSNLACGSGKTFREEFRKEKTIKEMKAELTRETFIGEGLGIWNQSSKCWYTQGMIEACRELGRKRGLQPTLGRDGENESEFN